MITATIMAKITVDIPAGIMAGTMAMVEIIKVVIVQAQAQATLATMVVRIGIDQLAV